MGGILNILELVELGFASFFGIGGDAANIVWVGLGNVSVQVVEGLSGAIA